MAPNFLAISITLLVATVSSSVYVWRRRRRDANDKIRQLEKSLKAALDNCAAERQGRIRAQQDLRKVLVESKSDKLVHTSYPMAPIAIIQSCFSTRNGTPRQPLLVPLARACLMFNPARVAPASLEGLEEYSHCWIIYVFHLNTNLDKLWKHPSKSKFKAKIKVPGLKGGRKGVFATRSPHRPCPIGLTVAKVESIQGSTVLLSGVDLVDGTPVLDVKPYLPYSDSIEGARVPKWVKVDNSLSVTSVNFSADFSRMLDDCWAAVETKSFYKSPDEFVSLIRQVLSWDIRSLSQRKQPHNHLINSLVATNGDSLGSHDKQDEEASEDEIEQGSQDDGDVVYHLILERLDVTYRITSESNVLVEKVTLSSHSQNSK